MRTLVGLVLVVALSACGEPDPCCSKIRVTNYEAKPVTLFAKINNDYAESLFTLVVHPTGMGGSSSPQLFNDTRIGTVESATRDFTANEGDRVSFDFSSTSLGVRHTVPTVLVDGQVDPDFPTLEITYDYDLARAEFVIRWRWAL